MARTSSSSAMTSMRPKLTEESRRGRGEAASPRRIRQCSVARQPAPDDPRELFALILLQEVATALDCGVRLSRAARYVALERAVAAARDRVLVGERGEKRLLPSAQFLPGI